MFSNLSLDLIDSSDLLLTDQAGVEAGARYHGYALLTPPTLALEEVTRKWNQWMTTKRRRNTMCLLLSACRAPLFVSLITDMNAERQVLPLCADKLMDIMGGGTLCEQMLSRRRGTGNRRRLTHHPLMLQL